MTTNRPKPSSLGCVLLSAPTPDVRRTVADTLQRAGADVLGEIGRHAILFAGRIERLSLVTSADGPGRLAGVHDAQVFSGPMPAEHLESLPQEARDDAERWNASARVGAKLQRRVEGAVPGLGRDPQPLGAPAFLAPEDLEAVARRLDLACPDAPLYADVPFTGDESAALRAAIDQLSGEELVRAARPGAHDTPTVDPKAFKEWLAHRAESLARRLHPAWRPLLLQLTAHGWEWLALMRDPVMTGRMAVGVVTVNSSLPNGPRLNRGDRLMLESHTIFGLASLAAQHPVNQLQWVHDFHTIDVPVADFMGGGDDYWALPALSRLTFSGSTYDVASLRAAKALASTASEVSGRTLTMMWRGSTKVIFFPPKATPYTAAEVVARINLELTGNDCSLDADGRLTFTLPPPPPNPVGPVDRRYFNWIEAGAINRYLGFFEFQRNGASTLEAYRRDLCFRLDADYAVVVFHTAFSIRRGDGIWARSSLGQAVISSQDNWKGWTIGAAFHIVAHEVAHLFGALDEYHSAPGDPDCDCTAPSGPLLVPNGNCYRCGPHLACLMGQGPSASTTRLCGYTRAHVGWAHLFVETRTGNAFGAGTDDDCRIDIGARDFALDTPEKLIRFEWPVNDHEAGQRGAYGFWQPELRNDDYARFLVRKSADGVMGEWLLGGVRVWCASLGLTGAPFVDQAPGNWFSGENRTLLLWEAQHNGFVNDIVVEITTANEPWAGTNDDVYFETAGRRWWLDKPFLDDFERGARASYRIDPGVGLRRTDVKEIRIGKSPDGAFGSWKLGGVKLKINGAVVYDNPAVNRWIENGRQLEWSDVIP